MPIFLDSRDAGFDARFAALLEMKREDTPEVDEIVAGIIADVRARGDAAVIELTERFDRLSLTPDTLAVSQDEIAEAIAMMSVFAGIPSMTRAMDFAREVLDENEDKDT